MPVLTPDQKTQLDTNIKSMLSKGASQDDVLAYAKDFKLKFDTPEPVKIPSPKEFNQSIPSYAQVNQPASTQNIIPGVKSNVEDFADKSAEMEARNEVVKTQAKKITAERSGRKISDVDKDIADGKLVLSTDTHGNKIYGRKPGVGEMFVRSLFGNALSVSDAANIAQAKQSGSSEELRNTFEGISARKRKENETEFSLGDIFGSGYSLFEKLAKPETGLPNAQPSFTGEVSGMLGGMAPDIALATATGGAGNVAKMAALGTKMYASSYANTAQDLYERGKQEAISKGLSPDEASKLAANHAAKNAVTAAIPDAAVNTLFFSGALHGPAATNFVSAIKGAAKDAVKMTGLGMTQSATKSGVEAAQGYDVGDWVDKMLTSGGELAKMDALFKVLPLMKTLSKPVQSAIKEFAVDPVVKPFVADYLKTVPEGIDVMKDLNKYEAATKDLRGIVPEEKMTSIGGRMEKRVNRMKEISSIKDEVKLLEEKKANLPEALHKDINSSIEEKNSQLKSLQQEIGNIDGEIEKINKSKGTGLEHEVDEATGEKPFIEETPEVPEAKEEAPVKNDKPITVYRSGEVNNDVVYTAETKDYADQFAKEKGKQGEADVKEMQIQPKNVLDLTDSYNNKTSPLAVQKVLEAKGVEFTEAEKQRITALDENYSGDPTFSHIVNVPAFIDAAKRAGFDAIKQKETTVADEYGTMSDKEKDLHTSYAVIDPSIILDKDSRVAAQAEAAKKQYLADKEKEVGYQTFSNDNAKYQKEAEKAKQDFIGKQAEPDKEVSGVAYHGITAKEGKSNRIYLGDESLASDYGDGVVEQYNYTLKNPYVVEKDSDFDTINKMIDNYQTKHPEAQWHPDITEHVNKELEKQGYDGLVIKKEALDTDKGYTEIGGTYGDAQIVVFDRNNVSKIENKPKEEKPTDKQKEVKPESKTEAKPLTKQERSNNLIDAVRKFNDTAKNKRSERATMSNQIKMEAQELGLKLADNGGRLTLQSKAGKKLQKRGTETNKSISSTFDEANYSPETKEIVKIAAENPNIVSDLYIEGNDGIKMSRKQVESALKDFKEGKATVGAEAIHDRIQEMVDNGEVKHLDHTGLKEDTDNPPMKIKDWVELFKEPEPTELNEKERAIANEKINADIAEQIIKDEGLTKETIEENKHLFEGFPYTEEDYNNVKNYLDETGRRTEEPGENEQPGISNAEDKAASVPGKEGKENTGTPPEEHQQGETTGQGLKELQSAHDKAVRELAAAEKDLATKDVQQGNLPLDNKLAADNVQQAALFGAGGDNAKQILDPLKAKVKETKAALDKATKEAEVAKENENPDIFPTEKEQKVIIEKMGSPIGEWLKRAFTSNRGLPEMWMVLKDLATGRRQLAARNMRKAIYNLQDAVKQTKYTDTDKISEALKDTNGTAFQSLPPEIQTAVKDMRLMVDGFSEGLVTEGLVTPGQALTISDHIGEYLNRSYKLHTQKDWIKKVDPAVKADAIKFLTQQRLSEINADPNHASKTPAERMDLAQKLGEQDANDILTKKDTPTGQRYTEQFSKDLSTLKTRQDIPEPIRKLMGEYTDPVTQFAITISKLATLHSQAKLLNSLRDTFKGQLFFEKDEVRPEGFNYQVASDGSQAWNPLAGLYTSKNAIEALQENAQHMEAWHILYQKAFGTVKKFKTVYSVPTQVVNFFANPFISLANGHFNLGKLNKSWDYYKDTMFNKERGSDDVINTLVERNVIGQSVNLRQIRDMLGKDKADEFALSEFMKPKRSNWNPLKWIDKADKVMQNQYSASDSFWKVYGFMNEATGLSDALFGKKYKDLTGADKIKIDELASERIKNTYPTYDRALPALMAAGKNIPFVGNFMAFQAEVLRTVKNNILYAKQDLKDPNPKIKQMGAKRLAGLISYVGLKQGINLAAVMATGTAASSLWAAATGNDDEKSKRQSLDKFAPDFLQTHNLMVESKANGIYSVYDIDRLDPYNAAWQSLNGFAVGKDGGVAKAVEELAGPFVEPDMLLRAAMDINKNENFSGKPIYNTADTKERQFMDKMAYVYGVIEPTTAKLFNRARKADSPTKEVVASLFGARSYDIDVKLSFKSKVHEAEEKLSANSYFNYKDKEGTEKQELKDNFKRAVMELNDYYNSAVKLGASPAELNELLGKSFSRISGASRIKQIIKTGNVKDSDIDTIYKKKK